MDVCRSVNNSGQVFSDIGGKVTSEVFTCCNNSVVLKLTCENVNTFAVGSDQFVDLLHIMQDEIETYHKKLNQYFNRVAAFRTYPSSAWLSI